MYPGLIQNIRQGLKRFAEDKTLAQMSGSSVTENKKFYNIATSKDTSLEHIHRVSGMSFILFCLNFINYTISNHRAHSVHIETAWVR